MVLYCWNRIILATQWCNVTAVWAYISIHQIHVNILIWAYLPPLIVHHGIYVWTFFQWNWCLSFWETHAKTSTNALSYNVQESVSGAKSQNKIFFYQSPSIRFCYFLRSCWQTDKQWSTHDIHPYQLVLFMVKGGWSLSQWSLGQEVGYNTIQRQTAYLLIWWMWWRWSALQWLLNRELLLSGVYWLPLFGIYSRCKESYWCERHNQCVVQTCLVKFPTSAHLSNDQILNLYYWVDGLLCPISWTAPLEGRVSRWQMS